MQPVAIPPALLWGGFGLGLTLVAGAFLLLRQTETQGRLAARLSDVKTRYGADRQAGARPEASAQVAGTLIRGVRGLGSVIAEGGLVSRTTRKQLETTLADAGIREQGALGLFVGSKILLFVAVPLLLYLLLIRVELPGILRVGVVAVGAAIGLLGPDFVLGHMRAGYLKKLATGLPDALDMMIICAEAGLGLERMLERVSEEIRFAYPQVSRELRGAVDEMGLAADRRDALRTVAARVGVEGVQRLCATLIQSIQYGTPLGQALRILSVEMRQNALTAFEERAGRLPVLLTLPMVLFILPCIFMVVAGPAAIAIMREMSAK